MTAAEMRGIYRWFLIAMAIGLIIFAIYYPPILLLPLVIIILIQLFRSDKGVNTEKTSSLFGSSSNIEKELEECYIPMMEKMMNMSSQEAKDTFRNFLKKAKDDAMKDRTANLPADFGDCLLRVESTDIKVKRMLEKKRMEGVTNNDIRWWYNMHYLERNMMLTIDNWMRYAYYGNLIENYGINEEEAMKQLRKTHPMFGDTEDTTHTTGEDRPLPFELKDRTNIFLEKTAKSSPANLEKYKKEIEESSSYNAFVRKQIGEGKI